MAKYIATILHPSGLIIRLSSPFFDQFAHSRFMDTFFGHSSFIGFVHVSSRARFAHHGKLRSLPVKIRSSQKASFVTSQDSFSRKASFVTNQASLIFNRVSFITSKVWLRRSGGPRHHLHLSRRLFRPLSYRNGLGPFSRFRYGSLCGKWISSTIAVPPCRAHPPPSPFPPSSSDSKFQCCGQSFMRVR